MEELYVYCLLYIIGIDCDDEYKNALDRLYLENPEDEELLDLEGREYKDAMLHLNALMNDAVSEQKLDTEAFGKCLMSKLIPVYEGHDIYSFSRKLFELWTLLPENIQDQEPFHIFSYAVEYTENDERCGRQLCEKALFYYSSGGWDTNEPSVVKSKNSVISFLAEKLFKRRRKP